MTESTNSYRSDPRSLADYPESDWYLRRLNGEQVSKLDRVKRFGRKTSTRLGRSKT